jgi:hypothetical protein
MRYATWDIDFSPNPDEGGTTPLKLLGIFYVSHHKIAGYIPANEDILLLAQWGVVEITESAFFALALIVNPLVTMVDGVLVIPNLEIL